MYHSNLVIDDWYKLSIEEQLANIGSEIERAIKWKNKGKMDYANLASNRALELFDFTLNDTKYGAGIKEICRVRELWLDYFMGDNQYKQTDDLWHSYILSYTRAANIIRKK